ncbi:serine hydrolase [Mucilaginibacter sp. BT774]|uniref:serine hydrolase domain-containing protein n=1 Tax=Mucilaginibacter sp. BT774 TaxID=3062276 RepID=UPI00267566A3|nr:serine hydrolase [Mucilaginibacter sp. BT774]MDO3627955.1 serine hydrolase [Mucilaginibacter sp. BT774]
MKNLTNRIVTITIFQRQNVKLGPLMIKKVLLLFFLTASLSFAQAQIKIDTSVYVKNNKQLYAVVVSQNDKVAFSQYFNGKSDTTLYNNQSLTKSVMSLLIGIAIDKGYISSVDEKIVKYFPQLKDDTDKRKQDITIRQIMNQASGLWHEDTRNLRQYLIQQDPTGYVLKQPLVSEPGKVFYYSNAGTHLLSAILTKATGMTTLDFATKYLFAPLGIQHVHWYKMFDGYYDGCGLYSVEMPTTDMNKIGSLLLHKGYYNHKSIVPKKWIAEILNPAISYKTPWGFEGSTYALCFYHYNYDGAPMLYGLGWGGQFVFVIPDKKAVISVNESINNVTAIKASNLFLEKIFPIIYQQLQ